MIDESELIDGLFLMYLINENLLELGLKFFDFSLEFINYKVSKLLFYGYNGFEII